MNLGLEGRAAIVTGAGGGLGAAIARSLVAEGAAVVVADINAGKAGEVAQALTAAGGRAIGAGVDVTDEAAVAAMVERAATEFGRVDILVNNAGFTRDMRITKMAVADWESVIDVSLKGAFLCTRAVTPHMQAAEFGRIISISSRAYLGNPGQANYSAAKAGLLGFTRAMALELGRNKVTVNAVAPGIIGTEAVRGLAHFDKFMESAAKGTPLGRIGEPEDVADAVTFLASERASYITGEVLHVTGGRY